MSGRKNTLRKFNNIIAGDMSGTVTSPVTNIERLDNIGIQLNFTGTPTGDFEVQVSADHAQDTEGNVTTVGTWIPMDLMDSQGNPPTATGVAGSIYIDITQTSAPWIRVVYVPTSGVGVLNGFITAKEI